MLRKQQVSDERRFRLVSLFFLVLALWIVGRLFVLQIVQHNYYALFAMNSHEMYQQIHPDRGQVFFKNTRTGEQYPAAVNKFFYTVYAVPREIPAGETASTTNKLAAILQLTELQKQQLLQKLIDQNSSYRPVAKKVPEEIIEQLKSSPLPGVYFNAETYRYYPEENLAGPVLGFTSLNNSGILEGQYGIEGYFEKKLAGKTGFTIGEKGALGSWITLADRTNIKAENGPDLLLTIDRALEYQACARLAQGMKDYEAKSAALVLMDPQTGAVLAMCSLPDFDPNNYSTVSDMGDFNNTGVFTAYEPGSVFKTITMAAGLDLGLVTPNTTYTDPCELTLDGYKIHNAQNMCYGEQTMTQVLEKSINTGAAWVEEKVGNEQFLKYVQKFGFGEKTGITLDTEVAGDIGSLKRAGKVFGANGSFGQGLTATPIQLAVAYSAIANGGKLMKPYVVESASYDDGRVERTTPQVVDQVISERGAKLLSGMLVSVVENHYHAAQIDHYYIAGKTGTAQIAENGKYSDTLTNQTFAGFAPASHPRLTLIVKFEQPNKKWAEQTALPVFHDVLKTALDYYAVPGDK